MGMYTEIFARMELKKDTPQVVLDALRVMTGDLQEAKILPDHPLFKCHRWEMLGCGTSAYFPGMADSHVRGPSIYYGTYDVLIHANLKDYDGEIEKFFDWIDPYCTAFPGEFLGYELYEDGEPALHRPSTSRRRPNHGRRNNHHCSRKPHQRSRTPLHPERVRGR
jgi:hypothetical protein